MSDELVPESAPNSADGILDFLNDKVGESTEEELEVASEEETSEDEEVKETEEETEDKLELESEDSEDELSESFQPFNKQKFLKDFPDAFKKYPALEKGYYANRAYREIFPTLDDAKEAQAKVEDYDRHLTSLNEGKSSLLLKEIKEKDPANFSKVVNNYLGELREVDNQAYVHVISNVIEDAIISYFDAARSKGDEDAQNAARMIKNFYFGDAPIHGSRDFNPKPPESNKLEEDKKKWNEEKLNSAKAELSEKFTGSLVNTLKNNIDPKDQMTAFVKKQAIREAQELVDRAIKADKQFQNVVNKMWGKSQESGLSSESRNKIRSAYDSKARAILPTIIQKVRKDALSGAQGRTVTKERTKTLTPSSAGNSKVSGEKKPLKGSTLDFLNSLGDK